MHKQNENGSRPTFLQKFQGKNIKINREGLLQMLNRKQKFLEQPTIKKQSDKLVELDEYPSKILQSSQQMKKASKIKKSIFQSQQLQLSKRSQSQRQLDKFAFHLRKQQNSSKGLQKNNQFKLPIINRSKSQNQHMISKDIFIPKLQMIESERASRKKVSGTSFYSKYSDKITQKMEVNEYILRHLEFLDKFEKQFVVDKQIKKKLGKQ